jgi:hypothetical protein
MHPYVPEKECDCQKTGYDTREEALRVADVMMDKDEVQLAVYQCPFDPRAWHLTSREAEEEEG